MDAYKKSSFIEIACGLYPNSTTDILLNECRSQGVGIYFEVFFVYTELLFLVWHSVCVYMQNGFLSRFKTNTSSTRGKTIQICVARLWGENENESAS